jgi:hypothetical protein
MSTIEVSFITIPFLDGSGVFCGIAKGAEEGQPISLFGVNNDVSTAITLIASPTCDQSGKFVYGSLNNPYLAYIAMINPPAQAKTINDLIPIKDPQPFAMMGATLNETEKTKLENAVSDYFDLNNHEALKSILVSLDEDDEPPVGTIIQGLIKAGAPMDIFPSEINDDYTLVLDEFYEDFKTGLIGTEWENVKIRDIDSKVLVNLNIFKCIACKITFWVLMVVLIAAIVIIITIATGGAGALAMAGAITGLEALLTSVGVGTTVASTVASGVIVSANLAAAPAGVFAFSKAMAKDVPARICKATGACGGHGSKMSVFVLPASKKGVAVTDLNPGPGYIHGIGNSSDWFGVSQERPGKLVVQVNLHGSSAIAASFYNKVPNHDSHLIQTHTGNDPSKLDFWVQAELTVTDEDSSTSGPYTVFFASVPYYKRHNWFMLSDKIVAAANKKSAVLDGKYNITTHSTHVFYLAKIQPGQ